jgi:hypothetical protein
MSKAKIIFALIGYLIILSSLLGCSDDDPIDENNTLNETKIVNYTHMLAKEIKPGEEGWLGNPHPIGWCDICKTYHTRDECIERFKEDFYKKIKSDSGFIQSVLSLQGQKLGCYCKPKNCHGDVIKQWIDNNKEGTDIKR